MIEKSSLVEAPTGGFFTLTDVTPETSSKISSLSGSTLPRLILPTGGMKRASQPTGLPQANVPAWAQEGAPTPTPTPTRTVRQSLPQELKPSSCVSAPVVLCVDDAAAALRVSPKTVRRLVARGNLKAVCIGRLVRIPFSEIDRLITAGCPSRGGFGDGEDDD